MPVGILIPSDERKPLVQREFDSLESFQATVGGYVEAVDSSDDLSLLIHQEARIVGLPPNRRATLLWHIRLFPFTSQQLLRGDIVLVGPVDAEGTVEDVPSSIAESLLARSPFQVELRVAGEDWHRAPRLFRDYLEACAWALSWTTHDETVRELRVITAT